jgi:hypothetical protein
MPYELLADGVLLLHLGFVLFVVLGGFFVLRGRWVAWAHLPAVCWGTLVEVMGWICPLTPLEIALRRAADSAVYDTTFIERYLTPIVYPSGLTREIQSVLGGLVVGINVGVYYVLWRRARRRVR